MAFTFNGIGTTYYGKTDWRGNSYVTTEWFVFFFVPIVPLESMRVRERGGGSIGFYSRRHFEIVEHLPLQRKQVAVTFLIGWGALALFIAAIFILLPLIERRRW